ncbi:MAG TPA: orotidine-5'-phosphate decarboxylase [Kineosporiaceae bacterium]|nr:orotidine-5'-phosphate decarboxylase [Kineosporiaceae bacterium]
MTALDRSPFGERLARAVGVRGPLCVGIDPHPALLAAWGLDDDPHGLETFALTVVEALGEHVAVLKPQVAFFERHGSRGVAVLERVLAAAAGLGALTIADAKRGDIGSTMAAYADAFLGEGSPLAADAVTLSPYLGFGSLRPALDVAASTGRGVFVLALTSNPEGAAVQHARAADGSSVAAGVLAAARAENAAAGGRGSVGVVVGATLGDVAAVAPDLRIGGPILAPGLGAQGAGPADLARVFGPALGDVLATTSREVLGAGSGRAGGARVTALRDAAARTRDAVLAAVLDGQSRAAAPGPS